VRFIITILLVLIISKIQAQFDPGDYAWKILNNERRSQNILKLAEISNGDLIGVGYSTHRSEGGKDIYFTRISKSGQILKAASVGGRNDEEAHSVVYTPTGRTLVCGFSDSKNARQGVILEINKDYSTKLFYLDETRNNSEFNDIIYDKDENIYVCGTSNKKMFVSKFNGEGKLIKNYEFSSEGESSGKALCYTKDGNIVVTGSTENRKAFNKAVVLIVKLNSDLKELAVWNYGQDDCYIGNDIIELPTGAFAIAATGFRNRMNAPAIAYLSANGIQLYGQTFATFIEGGGTGLTITPCGDLVLTGIGSDVRGAKRTSSFAVRVNPGNQGSLVWRKPYFFGGDFTDECNTAYCTSDGNVVLAGFTSNIVNQDYYLYALKPSERDIESMTILKKVKILEISRPDLYRNDVSNIEITLKNESDQDITNFKLKIEELNINSLNSRIPELLLVDKIKEGEIKKINLPVSIFDNYKENDLQLKCTVVSASNINYSSMNVTTQIVGTRSPILTFEANENTVDLKNLQNISIPFEIKNLGNSTATLNNLNFSFNENVFLSKDFEVPTNVVLKSGEGLKIVLSCYVDSLFRNELIVINIKIGETSGLRIQEQEIKYHNVRRSFSVVNMNELIDDSKVVTVAEKDIDIVFPNLQSIIYLTDRRSYKVDIHSVTDLQLLTSKYSFLINEKKIPTDSIFTNLNDGNFIINVPLIYGNNELAFQDNSDKSIKILSKINVQKSDVNYYIYVIGTDIKDEEGNPVLKFGLKDVNDFNNKIKSLGLNEKNKVNITLYNTYTTTTAVNINGLFESILKKKNQFRPNDVIIIYWVAQGFAAADGNIMVKGSDLFSDKKRKFSPELYSNHLTKYFIPYYLDPLPCKKILLLDIFNKEELPDAKEKEVQDYDLVDKTVKAIKTFSNFDYVLSGDLGQKSYELENLKNGAFTYSVLKALENNKADINKDNAIELSEFFANISKTIPELIVKNRKEKYWKQNPLHLKSKPEEDVVIFYR